MTQATPAPAWITSRWFNTDNRLSLEQLRGKVIMLHSFQMLCPGCAIHALPQAQRVYDFFDSRQLAVVGLHTVFEHHAAMGADALAAFLHEYRYQFPVGIDQPRVGETTPSTMAAYGLRGTPSLLLIDRNGLIRLHHFGRMEDLELGSHITALIAEGENPAAQA